MELIYRREHGAMYLSAVITEVLAALVCVGLDRAEDRDDVFCPVVYLSTVSV